MKSKEDIKVAIADGSVIMRSGLASVLKHFSEFNFRINEITNQEALTIFLRLHTPDLLIINPLFAIGMNLATIRKTYPSLKIAALTSSLIDNQLLSDYDTTISINDDVIANISANMSTDGNVSISKTIMDKDKYQTNLETCIADTKEFEEKVLSKAAKA